MFMASKPKAFSWEQVIARRPLVKGRPRFVMKTGHAYTPKATLDYEKEIAQLYSGPKFAEGPIWVSLTFDEWKTIVKIREIDVETPSSKLRGDIDNYAKSVLDALNGVAFTDDKQIMRLDLRKQ
jgi:Holliday junction resolvase RusA-like endonuclease